MHFLQADATRLPFADDTFDMVFTSPPYIDARSYGIDAQRDCAEWIVWMLQVVAECVRVTKGLVLVNCAGVTRDWCYQPGPEGLLHMWWGMGGRCWRPAYWHRVGIPGSGGKQWLRADIEYVMAFTSCRGAIPWSDNTANGHPPKWSPGGQPSHRTMNGDRVNRDEWGFTKEENRTGGEGREANGKRKTRPPGPNRQADGKKKTGHRCTRGSKRGDTVQADLYVPPKLANPGNLVKGIKVGGGLMGHDLANENEAPFPLKLAQWFIRSHCPPGGIVLDPFSGSGTTVHAAATLGRTGIGCDIRFSQCELGRRRCSEVQPELFQ